MLLGGALASDGDHFAVGGQQREDGTRLVAAISAARLRQWLDRARGLGADPHKVVLDCTVWATPPGAITIAAMESRTIVAGGAYGGFSIEPSLAPSLVARWMHEAGAGDAAVFVEGDAARTFATAIGREVSAGPLPDPLETLANGAVRLPQYAPNLRQGDFAPAGGGRTPFKLWRFAALLLVAVVMLQVGSQLILGWRDSQTAAQILAVAEADFRAARPDVRRIVNLRAQVAALANAMEQSQRHPVIGVTDPILQALRQQPLARLDEVRHAGPGRDVELVLSAPQPAALEAVIELLRQQGLDVEARDQQPRAGRYVVELSVTVP
jgi:type II secretion system protein L